VLPTLKSELSSPQAAGYDMSESFLTTMREFVMAEAQECFWQQAVLSECKSNGDGDQVVSVEPLAPWLVIAVTSQTR